MFLEQAKPNHQGFSASVSVDLFVGRYEGLRLCMCHGQPNPSPSASGVKLVAQALFVFALSDQRLPAVNFRILRFVQSCPDLSSLPADSVAEAAFIGRSNVGKSSLINALADNQKLARTSNSPGRTQALNYFAFGDGRYLVDLPGYGYATAAKKRREHWSQVAAAYLGGYASRAPSIAVIVVDIRRGLDPRDFDIMGVVDQNRTKIHIVLNKTDCLSTSKLRQSQLEVERELAAAGVEAILHSCSAKKRKGTQELAAALSAELIAASS